MVGVVDVIFVVEFELVAIVVLLDVVAVVGSGCEWSHIPSLFVSIY